MIPETFLAKGGANTIAVRVYDDKGDGGIVSGPVRIATDDDDDMLLINFSGIWKFKLGNKKVYKDVDFDDSSWKEIKVPQTWESQGYSNYDGHAWYRNTIDIETNFNLKDLYLVMGKVDDYDQVFLNGELIGEHWGDEIDHAFSRDNTYNKLRGYKIPNKLLTRGKNVIAVRVYDGGGVGGIYEGPVGIMKEANYKELKETYSFSEHDHDVFNTIFDIFNW